MREYVQRIITASLLSITITCAWLFFPVWVISLILLAVLTYILAVEWPPLRVWPITPLYPILPFVMLILLNQTNQRILLVFLCIVVFSHDTGAYIFGKLFGRHKIMPQVSPGKSWEGFAGGYFCSLIVGMFFVYYTDIKIKFWNLPGFVLILNAAGLVGDLSESYLKRRVGLKDSGNILPGHGGLLDRFDSLLFAVFAFCILMFL